MDIIQCVFLLDAIIIKVKTKHGALQLFSPWPLTSLLLLQCLICDLRELNWKSILRPKLMNDLTLVHVQKHIVITA